MTDDFLTAFEARRAARLQADRSLTIAGETLTFRPTVAPEVGLRLAQMQQEVGRQIERNGNGDETVTITDQDVLQIGDETVLSCLEPEYHQAWARLRAPDAEQPLTFEEVFEVADYLLGKVAGIPTSAPADSSDGRTQTDKPSKGRSSSPAKTQPVSA